MSKILTYLSQILSARYGKDVRQSIHDAIHQCYDDGKAGSLDLAAREQINILSNGKIGYPDYDKSMSIIRQEDVRYTIEEDGYVFLYVSDTSCPSYPIARLTINDHEAVKVSCSLSAYPDEVGVEYTSPLFPVKTGDVVSTVDCAPFDRIECTFVPLLSSTESESLFEDAVENAVENYLDDYLAENPVQPGATAEQVEQINKNTEDIGNLSKDNANLTERVETLEQNGTGSASKEDIAKAVEDYIAENPIEVSDCGLVEVSTKTEEVVYQAKGTLISDNWDTQGTGGYYDGTGKWTPNDSYRWFRIDKKDAPYQLYTEDFTGVCFIHIFNGEPSESTYVAKYRSNDSNLPTVSNPLTVEEGHIVVVQNTSSSSIKVICNVTKTEKVLSDTLTKAFAPNIEKGEQNIAWFGDSISQLQLLPHRVAEHMGVTIHDCSFAGSPLTYGAEAYQGTGFMSLASQIASGDFAELENALSKQDNVTEDKRGNADRLKALDFSTITDIVVLAGTNDVNNDYVATSTDLTKFKDGMRTAIDTIQGAYPQINLYFVSNPYRGDVDVDKNGNSLEDFINAEKEVCEEKNIPFYDLYHNSGINPITVDFYLMDDKLHQNERGDILLAKKIAKWLMVGTSTGSGGASDYILTDADKEEIAGMVEIPSGGSEEWELIADITVAEKVTGLLINEDVNGNPFELKKAWIRIERLLGDGEGGYAGILPLALNGNDSEQFVVCKQSATSNTRVISETILESNPLFGTIMVNNISSYNDNSMPTALTYKTDYNCVRGMSRNVYPINSFKIGTAGAVTVMGVGSNVKICGVRA